MFTNTQMVKEATAGCAHAVAVASSVHLSARWSSCCGPNGPGEKGPDQSAAQTEHQSHPGIRTGDLTYRRNTTQGEKGGHYYFLCSGQAATGLFRHLYPAPAVAATKRGDIFLYITFLCITVTHACFFQSFQWQRCSRISTAWSQL